MLVTTGGGRTVISKASAVVTDPSGERNVIGPVAAPQGTVAPM
jgi:hypothetical protein